MTGHTGGCACGAVRYRVAGPLRPVIACHCTECRRMSGHYAAATACRRECLRLEAAASLRWWSSSADHRRGFCAECGSLLFWEREGTAGTSIFAGTLDQPTGLTLAGHIYTAEKGDYYEIADGLPQAERRDPTLTTQMGEGG
ncbi:MAG TPA: GFA family protein [Thermohalobaculum sp.]|nr:GFA family protein [Thermohalobaculum sp.]